MLAVENFGELTKQAVGEKTLANGQNNLLASKTLANQANILITSHTRNSPNFRKSIRKLLCIKWAGAPCF